MKLVFKTKKNRGCFVKVPNYFTHENIPDVVEQLKTILPLNDNIVESTVYLQSDDWLTNDEHKQLDTNGEIFKPLEEIKFY